MSTYMTSTTTGSVVQMLRGPGGLGKDGRYACQGVAGLGVCSLLTTTVTLADYSFFFQLAGCDTSEMLSAAAAMDQSPVLEVIPDYTSLTATSSSQQRSPRSRLQLPARLPSISSIVFIGNFYDTTLPSSPISSRIQRLESSMMTYRW